MTRLGELAISENSAQHFRNLFDTYTARTRTNDKLKVPINPGAHHHAASKLQ